MPESLFPSSPAQNVFDVRPPAAPTLPNMREFGDAKATRKLIYDNTLTAAKELAPLSDDKYTLSLHDVDWVDPERFTRKQRKEAVLGGGTLARRMRGTWRLTDNLSGQPIGERKQIVARVPYLSSAGTITHNGNEYTVRHQARLEPGVFARIKANGEIESHVNAEVGSGQGHRYFLDPEKGIFKMRVHQAEIPLMPLLGLLGASDQDIRGAWGNDLYAANAAKNDSSAIKKLAQRLLRANEQDGDEGTTRQRIIAALDRTRLNPEVTQRTLGQPYDRVNKDMILAATKKLLAISRGEADPDDRDSLAFQRLYGPEDLLAERIRRDHGNVRRNLFRKIARSGTLDDMPSGALTPQLEQLLLGSGLAQNPEEVNALELFDKQTQITRMGEGGIPNLESIPMEARAVSPSHVGYIDLARTPESLRVGVDTHVASGVRKGSDGRLYRSFLDKSGQSVWKSPQDIYDVPVTTSDVMSWDTKRVPAIKGGRTVYVPKAEVAYTIPDFENAFSSVSNLIPAKSASKPHRASMGARYLTQALPLTQPEAPLVRSSTADGRSYVEEYAKHVGAVKAEKPGQVIGFKDGNLSVRYDDGTEDEIELYQNHPNNRKTLIHQTPTVAPGSRFQSGQLLARSNYTDDNGVMALGLNARTAFVPYYGYNHEDGIVVSESFAKRATSEHAYQHELEVTDRHKVGKSAYVGLFPSKFRRSVLDKLDDDGIMKPGQTVEYGEPLILAAAERDTAQNKVHRKGQKGYSDAAVLWEHRDPGVVTDVVHGKNGPVVLVKSQSQMQEGDKLSGSFGNKGIVTKIVPDHKMPHDREGRPFEVLLQPDGTTTRANPNQNIEGWLGKVAAKTGQPIQIPDFDKIEDLTSWAQQNLKQHGLSGTEDIIWPETGRRTKGVSTGVNYLYKLHHTAETKSQGRGSGGYSGDEEPAKGGAAGSKRVAVMSTNALLSHGAIASLRDAVSVRGQENDDLWLQFMSGHTPAKPRVPLRYKKFVDQLKASGINVVRDGSKLHIMALTDADVDQLAGDRVIRNGETVRFDKDLKPVPGGLFDPKLTGAHNGNSWAAIALPEPMPSPVFEEPIRRVLGLTQKQFQQTLSGEYDLPGYGTGAKAIGAALDDIDLSREIAKARAQWHSTSKTAKDEAGRKWGYLESAERLGIHPRDWMLKRVPVLPPAFRPIAALDGGTPLIADVNMLYKELIEAGNNYQRAEKELGHKHAGAERLAIYDAFKAVTGLGDPVHPKLVEKNVKGLLGSVFGSSPKHSAVQRKLISSTVDNVGRSVITLNPEFDMDTIGVPENQAYDVYEKFIVRRLRRQGLSIRDSLRHVRERTPLARDTLQDEMEKRPIYADRAPIHHKYGIMAFRPKLVKGNALQVSPLILKGFGGDIDGDQMNWHVPTTDEAVQEAYDRMLPSRSLISPADFKTPMFTPGQQYAGGLYEATREPDTKEHARVFASKADALAAYLRHEISVNTPVQIVRG